MIKLIITDIDGTIYSPKKKISNAVKDAIDNAIKNGINVTIASGRNSQSIRKVITFLNNNFQNIAIIGQNGSEIFSLDSNNVIKHEYISTFSKEESDWLFKLIHKYKLDVFSYNTNPKVAFVSRKYSPMTLIMTLKTKRKPIVYNLNSSFLPCSIMKMIIRGKKENILSFKSDVLNEGFSLFDFSYTTGNNFTVEVNPKMVNKAEGIKYLMKKYNIKSDEILYFGDGDNDIESLKLIDNSFAMGNAKEEVKKAAKFVAGTLEEDGVAQIINQVLKNKKIG